MKNPNKGAIIIKLLRTLYEYIFAPSKKIIAMTLLPPPQKNFLVPPLGEVFSILP